MPSEDFVPESPIPLQSSPAQVILAPFGNSAPARTPVSRRIPSCPSVTKAENRLDETLFEPALTAPPASKPVALKFLQSQKSLGLKSLSPELIPVSRTS